MEPKYDLIDLSEAEQKQFMMDFNKFLTAQGVYFEPVPAYSRKTITSPWELTCQLFLKKKVVAVEKKDLSTPDETPSQA